MKSHLTDNQMNAERLSALMDGELSSQELDELLTAMDQDPQLKQLWRRMHLGQGVMTQSSQSAFHVDISSAVMCAVQQDPNIAIGSPSSETSVLSFPNASANHLEHSESVLSNNAASQTDRKQVAGSAIGGNKVYMQIAMAAGLAMFALFTWNNWGGGRFDGSNDSGELARVSSQPGELSVSELPVEYVVIAPSQNSPSGSRNAPAENQVAGYATTVSLQDAPVEEFRVERRKNTQQEYVQWRQLEPYMMAHTVRSVHPARTGMISFGRVVDPDTMPKPVVKVFKVSR